MEWFGEGLAVRTFELGLLAGVVPQLPTPASHLPSLPGGVHRVGWERWPVPGASLISPFYSATSHPWGGRPGRRQLPGCEPHGRSRPQRAQQGLLNGDLSPQREVGSNSRGTGRPFCLASSDPWAARFPILSSKYCFFFQYIRKAKKKKKDTQKKMEQSLSSITKRHMLTSVFFS